MIKNNKVIGLICVALLFFTLLPRLAFSDCPSLIDTPDKLRLPLRTIILDYLSNPNDPTAYSQDEIRDLIDFYKNWVGHEVINDCYEEGTRSNVKIIQILSKKVHIKTECNDGKDNDKDSKIDFGGDPGCSEALDNDETNCGDGVCGKSENCVSCSSDCECPLVPMNQKMVKHDEVKHDEVKHHE